MTKTPVEVITSVQRRRRWSTAEKERIVAAAIEPGAVASEVARAAEIHTSQLFRWRQQLCKPSHPVAKFAPVSVAPEPVPASPSPVTPCVIEIEFATGVRMRMTGSLEPSAMSALIAALAKRKRRR